MEKRVFNPFFFVYSFASQQRYVDYSATLPVAIVSQKLLWVYVSDVSIFEER